MSSQEVSNSMDFEATPLPSSGSLTAEQVRQRLTGAALGHALPSNPEAKERRTSVEIGVDLVGAAAYALSLLRVYEASNTPQASGADEARVEEAMAMVAVITGEARSHE